MRIGVFGGSFDPVHLGHLVLAEQCRDQARLDRVLFVPSPRPPHKLAGASASFADRTEMLRLAIAGEPAFAVDTLEGDRTGPSYTVDTLRELHRREPGNEWFLLLGSDSVRDLPTWRQPYEIARLAKVLFVGRPGTDFPALPAGFDTQKVNSPLIDVSSTGLRQRIAARRSIRYLVPRAVEEFIATRSLYLIPSVNPSSEANHPHQ